MYNPEYFECPGCRNACPADRLTCGIGEKFYAQFKKAEQAKKAKQAESQTCGDSGTADKE